MVPSDFSVSLPEQVSLFLAKGAGQLYPADEDKMRLAIALARLNVENETGGPFGAAIFDAEHRLVAGGVNRVVPACNCTAHGEMVAFALAGAARRRFNAPVPGYTLATSAQMCGMCLTATIWSGVSRVLYAASSEAVEKITGFDEGIVPPNWIEELNRRGIEVRQLMAEEGEAVLQLYVDNGGFVYNGDARK